MIWYEYEQYFSYRLNTLKKTRQKHINNKAQFTRRVFATSNLIAFEYVDQN